MKNILVLSIVFLSAISAYTQSTSFFLEEQNVYAKGQVSPSGFLQTNRYFKDSKYGMFTYAFLTQGWGEIIVGATKTYALRGDGLIEVGLGGGIETSQTNLRSAAYIFTIINLRKDGKYKLTGLVNGEYGGSGYWYVGFLTSDIAPKIALGVHAQYGAAWGPRLQYRTKHLLLWGTIGRNMEANSFGAVTGVRVIF
jgi:hypothetical protein